MTGLVWPGQPVLISLFGKRPKLKLRKKVEKEKIIDNLLTIPITIIFKELTCDQSFFYSRKRKIQRRGQEKRK